jgi:hypothetical protein
MKEQFMSSMSNCCFVVGLHSNGQSLQEGKTAAGEWLRADSRKIFSFVFLKLSAAF